MSSQDNIKLDKGSLNTFSILFFVIAAASPLTGVIGALPVSFLTGNGIGVPGIFILVGILLIIFSFGFVAMSRYITNTGAFYAYILHGLGVRLGFSGLGMAITAYTAMIICCSAMFGFFTQQLFLNYFGINLPWLLYSVLIQILVVILGIAKVEIGSRVLGILMLLEVGIILVLDFSILRQPTQLNFTSFQPNIIFSGNFGISIVFAICSFMGFEAAAIYSEECKNPQSIIKKVAFSSIIIILCFYSFTSWCLIQYTGTSNLLGLVSRDPGNFLFIVAHNVLGEWSVQLILILLITSLFAATQALHNSLSRYIYTMGRDKIIWPRFSEIHYKYKTPYLASIFQGFIFSLFYFIFFFLNLDPIIDIFSSFALLGSLAFLSLLLGVSISALLFLRNKKTEISFWSRLVCPTISTISIAFIIVIIVQNANIISGSDGKFIAYLPWIIFLIVILGAIFATTIKLNNPLKYEALSKDIQNI